MKIALLTTDNREPFFEHEKPLPWFGMAPEALLQGFAQLPEAEIHVVCCLRKPAPAPAKLADNIWYHQLLVPKIGWMTTGFQGCIRAARRKLRELQPEIVHGQGTERESALCAVFSGFPNVLTLHGNMRLVARINKVRPFSYDWLAARLEPVALARTQGVVCITRYTEEAVTDLVKRTWIVPNAVDSAFYGVNASPETSATVLCIGNVCQRKNQNAFIRALDELARVEKFRLRFLGAASKNTAYGAEFFDLLQSRSWCEWGGMADRERVRQELQSAAALALPSIEDNCPMVILEAMAAGVPVAAARVGGVPDLVAPERTGLLFDPQQPAEIAGSIRRLLTDRPAAVRLATTAKQSAVERFHPKVIAQAHLDIYREVLARRRG